MVPCSLLNTGSGYSSGLPFMGLGVLHIKGCQVGGEMGSLISNIDLEEEKTCKE